MKRLGLEPPGQFEPFTYLDFIMIAAFLSLIVFCFGIVGCSTAQSPLQSSVIYRYDMQIQINGQSFDGVAIAQRAPSYHFKIESQSDMDMFTITSCSRETAVPSAIKAGWFGGRKGYEFDYVPNKLESAGGCPLRLGGYDKTNGRHSWALIDFEGDEKLQAALTCNGQPEVLVNGVGVCQSHAGLQQELRFIAPVDIAVDSVAPSCRIAIPADHQHWIFNMPESVCTMAFMERAKAGNVLRLTTIGYDQIVIRSE